MTVEAKSYSHSKRRYFCTSARKRKFIRLPIGIPCTISTRLWKLCNLGLFIRALTSSYKLKFHTPPVRRTGFPSITNTVSRIQKLSFAKSVFEKNKPVTSCSTGEMLCPQKKPTLTIRHSLRKLTRPGGIDIGACTPRRPIAKAYFERAEALGVYWLWRRYSIRGKGETLFSGKFR